MEHIERQAVHFRRFGPACLPPGVARCRVALAKDPQWSRKLALALQRNRLNQPAICRPARCRGARREQVFIIEANPRASRTVPFVAKATACPLRQS